MLLKLDILLTNSRWKAFKAADTWEIFTVRQFLSCKNFLDLPFWRHNTTAPKSSKIHEIRIWGVHQAFWSVHMKVGDLIVHENYLPSNRNQTERRNNEWFSFGSILLYYYFSLLWHTSGATKTPIQKRGRIWPRSACTLIQGHSHTLFVGVVVAPFECPNPNNYNI